MVDSGFKPSARTLEYSVSEHGIELITYEATYHRYIHSELMTHRMLSKNSASSRAIPLKKTLSLAGALRVGPVSWGRNQKGMSSREELTGQLRADAQSTWDWGREQAIKCAEQLESRQLHKQYANRVLEAYLPITVILSGTEWEGFYEQRDHQDAQPEINLLARELLRCKKESKPRLLREGEWHLPLIFQADRDEFSLEDLIKISIGRCARVSYLTHEGLRDPQKDIELYWQLAMQTPKHLTPLEHAATPGKLPRLYANMRGWKTDRWLQEAKVGQDLMIGQPSQSVWASRARRPDLSIAQRYAAEQIVAFLAERDGESGVDLGSLKWALRQF